MHGSWEALPSGALWWRVEDIFRWWCGMDVAREGGGENGCRDAGRARGPEGGVFLFFGAVVALVL